MADFLRQKYFYDLNYNRSINKTLQRSNSVVPFTSNEHLALMESPELLFYISLDILSFRSNLLRYCNDLIKDLADIEPFFQTHQDASLYLQSLQTNWNNEWMRGFFLIEAEMKELIKKHNLKLEEKLLKSIAEDAECYHQPKTKNNSKKLKVINDLVEAPKNLMKSRLALKDNRYSPISNCSSGSTIIKVTSISPLSNASSSSTIEVTPENCVISTIAEIHHRNNALDHMNTSVDNVSDILDAISDNGLKSEDSFNLRLSTSSSEISLKKRKLSSPDQVFKDVLGQKGHTLKKTCVVNISFSEQEICNKRIKSSRPNAMNGQSTPVKEVNIDGIKASSTSKRKLSFSSDSSSDLSSIISFKQTDEVSDIIGDFPNEGDTESWAESDRDILDSISVEETTSEDDSSSKEEKSAKKRKSITPKLKSGVMPEETAHESPKKANKSDASWKNDPLLKESLDESTGSVNKNKRKKLSKSPQKSSCSTLDKWLIRTPSSKSKEVDDSDFESASSRQKHKLDSQVSASPSKKGRKNIKDIISEDNLNEATLIARKAEQLRIERLKEKQNSQSQAISSSCDISSTEYDFVLDSSDDNNVIVVHHGLAQKLMSHQKKGVMFMWDNCYESVKRLQEDAGGGCILAHCMGLGKTFQVIVLVHTLLSHPVTNTKKVLVICPLSTVINWKAEFRSAMRLIKDPLPKMDVFTIGKVGTNTSDRSFAVKRWHHNGGVLIVGYEAFVSMVKATDKKDIITALVDPGADLVVCDEGHLLKNGKTDRTKFISNIVTKRRIILTGTPMQNNLEEYYYMVTFVKPTFLGTYTEYRNRFVNPINNGQYEDSSPADIRLMKNRSHVLNKMTKAFIQRYEESELYQHLPKKFDYAIKIELHEEQMKLYELFLNTCNKQQLFANLTIFRLIYTHPRLLELHETHADELARKARKNNAFPITENLINPTWWANVIPKDAATNIGYGPKLVVMMDIIKECSTRKEKLLLFSNSRRELDLIELFLKQDNHRWMQGRNYYRMDGTVPIINRTRYCKEFNLASSNICLLLLTTGIGGLGLNLTGANRAILMDVNWNPTIDSQSIFRIYRLGQTKPCFVYRLIAKGTIEEVIYERSVTKQAIAGRVVDEMQISRHFNSSEMEAMYRCDFAKNPRPVLRIPQDNLLATMIQKHGFIYAYQDHKELLQNLPEEELNEEEMKLAWEEYQREKDSVPLSPAPVSYPNSYVAVLPQSSSGPGVQNMIQPTIGPSTSYSVPNTPRKIQMTEGKAIFVTSKGNVLARFSAHGELIYPKENISKAQINVATQLFNVMKTRPYLYLISTDGKVKNIFDNEQKDIAHVIGPLKTPVVNCPVIDLSE